jgi:ribonuclease G
MEHLVRVHLKADAEVPPHTFRVEDTPSNEPLPESP